MKQDTICWSCKNCCGKCSWSNGTFTAVDGWDATPTEVNMSNGVIRSSYIVHKCPKYEFNSVHITTAKLARLIGLFNITDTQKAMQLFKSKFKGYNIRQEQGLKKNYFIIEKEEEPIQC